jgi:uncharacterized membrane protein
VTLTRIRSLATPVHFGLAAWLFVIGVAGDQLGVAQDARVLIVGPTAVAIAGLLVVITIGFRWRWPALIAWWIDFFALSDAAWSVRAALEAPDDGSGVRLMVAVVGVGLGALILAMALGIGHVSGWREK